MAKIIDGDDDGESKNERDGEKEPAREELADDGLPRGDGHGEQKFDGADAAFFGPEAHADSGHEEQVEPGMPEEEVGREGGFAAIEKSRADCEREKAGE